MIEVTHHDSIAILRMANGRSNAMSLEFCELLSARFEELAASSAHAVVITGTGKIFSAGVDLVRLLVAAQPTPVHFCRRYAACF
jgi:enoyl-CoA hydratase